VKTYTKSEDNTNESLKCKSHEFKMKTEKHIQCGTIFIIALLTLWWIELLRARMALGHCVVKARLLLKLTLH